MSWPEGRTYSLKELDVTLSAPVLVARHKGFLWFPTLAKLPGGDLLATMTNYADVTTNTSTAFYSWSCDGGLTWSELTGAPYGDVNVPLPSGDMVLLPYYLFPAADGMTAPYNFVARGTRTLQTISPGVTVTGWPYPDKPSKEFGVCGFVFNGQALRLNDGRYLATLYGTFEQAKRYSLVGALSEDAIHWSVRTMIAAEHCPLEGVEGPCEAALCRLQDGMLMCVFRMGGGYPYGQSFSRDEGRSWTAPHAIPNAFSVQPSLAVMPDGLIALSGGRPSPFLWFNPAGDGLSWRRLNLEEHHNAFRETDAMFRPNTSSCYTEVVALDDRNLLCIYDRIPFGWAPIPPASPETNSVWVVRATVRRR